MPTALLVVDHGSKRDEANQMLFGVAEMLRRQKPGLIVHVAHMELAEPTIAQGFAACVKEGATEVIVHPYMLSPGRHATKDIPNLAKEAAGNHPGVTMRLTQCLGIHDKLGEVVLERSGIA